VAFDGYIWDEIIISLIIVAGTIAVYYILRYFINRAADSLALEKGQLKGIYSITKLVLLVIAITMIIFQFSSLSGVAAGAISVAAGTIIGFSSRNTISNAIAGILLLASKPFKIGDRIRTSDDDRFVGDVIEITILYTKIKTIRNELVTIPNQMLLQREIVNYSGMDVLAVGVEIALTYDNDRTTVEKLMVDSAAGTTGIMNDPRPSVMLKRFDQYAAVYELRAFTDRPNEHLQLQSEIRKNIYDAFKRRGLDITVPQAQVNVEENMQFRDSAA
jgi:small-conductance mechanosensitive channel